LEEMVRRQSAGDGWGSGGAVGSRPQHKPLFFFQEADWLRELGGEAWGVRGGTLKTVDVSTFIFLGIVPTRGSNYYKAHYIS